MDEVESLLNIGYQCYTVPYGRNDQKEPIIKKIFITVFNALRISRHIRKAKPNFLYLNSRFEPVGSVRDFITLIILKVANRKIPKIIIKSHGSNMQILESHSILLKRFVLPFLIKNVKTWIFLSKEEKSVLEQSYAGLSTRIHVLPNIINAERCFTTINIKQKYQLPAKKFICLFVGRLVKAKGVYDIINSIGYLKNPASFHFLLVGEGKDMKTLKREAEKYSIINNIQFTGFVPDVECDQIYPEADVLIYPTYDMEGFSMALFKSIACGLPVITTKIRAAKDYLKEPENVLWVNPQSPKEIASALERVYSDISLRTQMSKNNRELGERFSSAVVGTQLDALLKLIDYD